MIRVWAYIGPKDYIGVSSLHPVFKNSYDFPPVVAEDIPFSQASQICLLRLTSSVTHLSPSCSSSLCAFTPHSLHHCIHLSVLLSLCSHPTIPPTPCVLTALSLDGSSSSKAVTMMDCPLPHPLPLPLPLALSRSALAVKALTRSRHGICFSPVCRWHRPGHGCKGRRRLVSLPAPATSA